MSHEDEFMDAIAKAYSSGYVAAKQGEVVEDSLYSQWKAGFELYANMEIIGLKEKS
jgi:hypothetical protein